MRLLPTLLIAAACGLTAAPSQAQGQRFTDADFELSIELPDGMRELTFDERVATLGLQATPDVVRNTSRADAGDGEWSHNHIWVDLTPIERFIHMTIADSLPFASPQEFITAMGTATSPVIKNGTVEPEEGGPAVWIEKRFAGASGQFKRLRAYYYVDPGNQRSMLVKLQALESAWDTAEPQFLSLLGTLDWERKPAEVGPTPSMVPPNMAGSGTTQTTNRGRRSAGVGSLPTTADDNPSNYASWGDREVLGSLIIAGLLLMALLFGGRGA